MVLLYFGEKYTTAMAMDFQRLQSRLIANLRERVRSGEITERSLARVTGISQPHLHNVLKGKRLLSVGKADQILRQLHLDLADLMDTD
jgi:transcriptional regulator with XRE-family HTH domain